jgi:hypothetical protein
MKEERSKKSELNAALPGRIRVAQDSSLLGRSDAAARNKISDARQAGTRTASRSAFHRKLVVVRTGDNA